jgi:hypothetical protein
MNIIACCSIVLSAGILLIIQHYTLNATALLFNGDVFIPNCSVVFCKAHNVLRTIYDN